MTTYVSMLSNVSINAPMCPQPLMLNAIQRAAQDFFTRARVWHVTIDALYVSPKVRDIDVEHPTGARIVSALAAAFNGADLTVKTPRQLDGLVPEWRTTATGEPEYITQLSTELIRLAPHPEVKGKLEIEAALAPTLDAASIPDELAAEYRTALEHGASQILLAIPQKGWSDPAMSQYHGAQFEKAITTAFTRQSLGFTGARLRSRLEHR